MCKQLAPSVLAQLENVYTIAKAASQASMAAYNAIKDLEIEGDEFSNMCQDFYMAAVAASTVVVRANKACEAAEQVILQQNNKTCDLAHNATEIRKALANNCFHVILLNEHQVKHRITGVRTTYQGALQVRAYYGWHTLIATDRIYQA